METAEGTGPAADGLHLAADGAVVSKEKQMHGRKRTPHDTHPTYASSADYPTQDGSDRCANDQQIRALGFTILRRQKGKAAVWQDREGREYSQEECERLVLGLEDASAAARLMG